MREMFTILLLSMGLFLCAVLIVLYCLLVGMHFSALLREAAEEAEAGGEGGGERGLTAEELERLEEGKMAMGDRGVCAVCQDEMEEAQAARVLPGCRHAFHQSCADAWLQRQPTCPLCRVRIHPSLSLPLNPNPSHSTNPSLLLHEPDDIFIAAGSILILSTFI